MTISQFPPHLFPLSHTSRHLAYSAVGDVNSGCVLLCLPGLLETRATFDPLLQAAEGVHGLRVISVDHCGRGDSSPMPGDKGYTMQVYLDDLEQFIRQELIPEGKPMPRIEVLGTSMGGILGMYLVHEARNHISGLLLNDIGLSLQWMSIYGLYDGMKKAGRMPEPQELADSLNVHVGAVVAVSSPAHFDLPYRKDWKGMQFGQLLNGFKGPVRLVHGGDSGVCLSQQVTELKHAFPAAQVLEVAGATHPVPFNASVNQFVLQSLSLPAAAQAKPAPVQNVKKVMFFETPVATPKPEPLPEPVMEPEPVPPQEAEPRGGLLALLKRLLSATKK